MKKIIVILDFASGEVNKIEYNDNKEIPYQIEVLEEIITLNGYDINNIEWMSTTEEKILLDDDDLFGGYCPKCNDDDLEQIDGDMDCQELKCTEGHRFIVESKGWKITK